VKLYAISDLHLHAAANWEALPAIPPHPDDWLIIAGDVSETEKRFEAAVAFLAGRFARVFWTPGNHDLWTMPQDPAPRRGVAKYERLVEICRRHGVLTPEDPFVSWPGDGPPCLIAPIFTLYDYSFRSDDVPLESAVAWAAETGVVCTDEVVLHPDPFPSRQAWCHARCRLTEERLQAAADQGDALLLAGHFPLRYDLAQLRRIPRFSVWCGTRLTESWHTRFPVVTAVHGHLHIRATHFRDGVRFEEVSLGYPQQWHQELGIQPYLRQILPLP
jgi:3',5'-cyclic AMP phosphodiesterase CpdA